MYLGLLYFEFAPEFVMCFFLNLYMKYGGCLTPRKKETTELYDTYGQWTSSALILIFGELTYNTSPFFLTKSMIMPEMRLFNL